MSANPAEHWKPSAQRGQERETHCFVFPARCEQLVDVGHDPKEPGDEVFLDDAVDGREEQGSSSKHFQPSNHLEDNLNSLSNLLEAISLSIEGIRTHDYDTDENALVEIPLASEIGQDLAPVEVGQLDQKVSQVAADKFSMEGRLRDGCL